MDLWECIYYKTNATNNLHLPNVRARDSCARACLKGAVARVQVIAPMTSENQQLHNSCILIY